MPTNPFVSPGIDDRPRHRQNLPAGIAYPPAARRGARPGELRSGQPAGRGLGAPGPSAGYGYTLAERAKGRLRLAPHEAPDDAVSVIAEVASRRASRFGRAPVMGDIDFAIVLLGYDGGASDDFVTKRALWTHEAAHHYPARRRLVDTVPEELLGLSLPELASPAASWRAGLGSH